MSEAERTSGEPGPDRPAGDTIPTEAMRRLAMRWTAAQPAVAGFISSLVPSASDAEEILQQTAAAVVTSYDRYDDRRPFVAWVIGVARVEVMRYRRGAARSGLLLDEHAIEAVERAYARLAPETREMQAVLRICIAQLTDRLRGVLTMRYVAGMSAAAIAEEIQVSTDAVRGQLHRARGLLRTCMEHRLGLARQAAREA